MALSQHDGFSATVEMWLEQSGRRSAVAQVCNNLLVLANESELQTGQMARLSIRVDEVLESYEVCICTVNGTEVTCI